MTFYGTFFTVKVRNQMLKIFRNENVHTHTTCERRQIIEFYELCYSQSTRHMNKRQELVWELIKIHEKKCANWKSNISKFFEVFTPFPRAFYLDHVENTHWHATPMNHPFSPNKNDNNKRQLFTLHADSRRNRVSFREANDSRHILARLNSVKSLTRNKRIR